MGVPKVLNKAMNLSRGMRSAAQRAKDKASTDSSEYDSPSEYAEHELSRITDDSASAAKKTVNKGGSFVKKRIKRRIDDRKIKKKLSEMRNAESIKDVDVKVKSHDGLKQVSNGRMKHAYSETSHSSKPLRYTGAPKVHPKNTASTVRQAPARTVKTTSRTVNSTARTVKAAERATVKTAEATKQTAQKTAQASKYAAQKAAAAAKAAAKAAVKAAQLTAKLAVTADKAVTSAVKGIVAAIAAGGWVAVVIIAGIAMIAVIVCSGFGIFFSNEGGGRTISQVIPTIERQFNARITYDINQIPLGRHSIKKTVYVGDEDGDAPVNNWNDVIAVFSVLATTREEDPMDVVVLTDDAEALLSHVYNRMNSYTITTGSSGEGGAYVLMCYVHRQALNYREGADLYDFNDNQREMLNEMMKPEYCSYYAQLLGVDVSGDTDINEILDLLPDEKGAEVVRAAMTKLGAPYVLGAKGDDKFDCSGLVYWAINEVDPDLGSHFWCCAADQAHYCENMTVGETDLRPGDLVFWVNRRCNGCGRWNEVHHTGIYIGMGKVIEASSSKGRVVIRDIWSSTNYPIFMFARPYN